ncbi:hypothetical protein EMCRGX_G028119 [Ephydatia muelleri]
MSSESESEDNLLEQAYMTTKLMGGILKDVLTMNKKSCYAQFEVMFGHKAALPINVDLKPVSPDNTAVESEPGHMAVLTSEKQKNVGKQKLQYDPPPLLPEILWEENGLSDNVINAAQKLLKARHSSIGGLQNILLVQNMQFQIERGAGYLLTAGSEACSNAVVSFNSSAVSDTVNLIRLIGSGWFYMDLSLVVT